MAVAPDWSFRKRENDNFIVSLLRKGFRLRDQCRLTSSPRCRNRISGILAFPLKLPFGFAWIVLLEPGETVPKKPRNHERQEIFATPSSTARDFVPFIAASMSIAVIGPSLGPRSLPIRALLLRRERTGRPWWCVCPVGTRVDPCRTTGLRDEMSRPVRPSRFIAELASLTNGKHVDISSPLTLGAELRR